MPADTALSFHMATPEREELGVMLRSEIFQRVREGSLSPEALCWCSGMLDWQTLREVFAEELGFTSAPAAEPEPPPPLPEPPPVPVFTAAEPAAAPLPAPEPAFAKAAPPPPVDEPAASARSTLAVWITVGVAVALIPLGAFWLGRDTGPPPSKNTTSPRGEEAMELLRKAQAEVPPVAPQPPPAIAPAPAPAPVTASAEPPKPPAPRDLRQAAEAGDAQAQYDLGMELLPKDQTAAISWLRKAARRDSIPAMLKLGEIFAAEKPQPESAQESFRWFHKAAVAGDPRAKHAASIRYRDGLGVGKDPVHAMAWLRESAEGGYLEAQYEYADQQTTIWPVGSREFARGLQWLEKAAEQKHPRACLDLGRLCLTGEGVKKDPARALNLLSQAARGGLVSAYEPIGMLYLKGDGVPKDRVEAQAYFILGADTKAKQAAVKTLNQQLTPSQSAKATARAAEISADLKASAKTPEASTTNGSEVILRALPQKTR